MNYSDMIGPKNNDYGLAWAETVRDRMEPPEPDPILHCVKCGNGIFEGEVYFHLDDCDVCEDCLHIYFGRYA